MPKTGENMNFWRGPKGTLPEGTGGKLKSLVKLSLLLLLLLLLLFLLLHNITIIIRIATTT